MSNLIRVFADCWTRSTFVTWCMIVDVRQRKESRSQKMLRLPSSPQTHSWTWSFLTAPCRTKRVGSRVPPLSGGMLPSSSCASCPLCRPSWNGPTNAVLADIPSSCTKLTEPISWFKPRGVAGGTTLLMLCSFFVAIVCFVTFWYSPCPEPHLGQPGSRARSRNCPC